MRTIIVIVAMMTATSAMAQAYNPYQQGGVAQQRAYQQQLDNAYNQNMHAYEMQQQRNYPNGNPMPPALNGPTNKWGVNGQ